MTDIKGVEIKPGMTVKSSQQSGGILPPTTDIGIVEDTVDAWGKPALCIRYRKPNQDFDRFILIDHRINEVIN
jgi:hypothetical protein